MALAAVMAADLFVGLNTHAWTGWVFFTTLIGILLVWVYTVRQINRNFVTIPANIP